MPALAGANVIYGLGMEEMGVNFNLAQLLIDADIADMILYTLQGMPVSDETLAVDVIDSRGSEGRAWWAINRLLHSCLMA